MNKKHIIAIALLSLGYIAFRFTINIKHEYNAPTFTYDTDLLQLSVHDDKSKLLEGVHASDVEDGDLTNNILIEGYSNFFDGTKRNIYYAVFDNDDHCAKGQRTVEYVDYEKPKFSIDAPLASSSYSDLSSSFKAVSSVDGDISNRIAVETSYSPEYNYIDFYDLSVTDSTGTESKIRITFEYTNFIQDYSINLKENIMYVKLGQPIDLMSNVIDVTDRFGAYPSLMRLISLQSNVDFNTAGCYEANYSLNLSNGKRALSKAIIVVE